MAERVYLHVGTPKSGTTYLQAVLWQNERALRADGFLLPGRFETHYAAAKGVTQRSAQLRAIRQDLSTAWGTLAAELNAWPGRGLVSHELLSPATTEQAAQAKRELGGAEVHVVLTARPLSRQLPASWQEQVKGGLPTSYEVFLRRVKEEQLKGEWFWTVQDVAAIARRWSGDLPPEHVHIVTVPATTDDPTLLWRRYAGALGIDPARYDANLETKNVSLGAVEVELLRRIHARKDPRFIDRERHRWTRKLLATELLGQRTATPIQLPPAMARWLRRRADRLVSEVSAAGYDVMGDLDELLAPPPATHGRRLGSVSEKEIEETAAWTIERLREQLIDRGAGVPTVPSGDGVNAILEMLEHVRAADQGTTPRPAPEPEQPDQGRLRGLISRARR